MEINSDILFYDGECGLCNRVVQFLLKNERSKKIKFCSLQSEKASQILKLYSVDLSINNLDTIYFISSGKIYSKSTAILKISAFLKYRFYIVQIGWLIPSFIRDQIYKVIANNRQKWKKSSCLLYSKEDKLRFLDQ